MENDTYACVDLGAGRAHDGYTPIAYFGLLGGILGDLSLELYCGYIPRRMIGALAYAPAPVCTHSFPRRIKSQISAPSHIPVVRHPSHICLTNMSMPYQYGFYGINQQRGCSRPCFERLAIATEMTDRTVTKAPYINTVNQWVPAHRSELIPCRCLGGHLLRR